MTRDAQEEQGQPRTPGTQILISYAILQWTEPGLLEEEPVSGVKEGQIQGGFWTPCGTTKYRDTQEKMGGGLAEDASTNPSSPQWLELGQCEQGNHHSI